MVKITINNNGVFKEIEVPETKVNDVELADKCLLFSEWLTTFLKSIKENCSDCIINNEGSEHFTLVKASESKKVNWEAVAAECDVPDSVVQKWTTYIARKAYVKVKKSLNFF